MSDAVRSVVRRLVAEARQELSKEDYKRFKGFMLTGGPGGACFLDEDGEVWNWYCDWEGSRESIERVPDGPIKVGAIAIAAERVPGLAAWLPRRPPGAADCHLCGGTGSTLPPLPRLQCPKCHGMGWVL